ncbi:MAG: cupin domain-containing protein [Armatimonadota bacterium]
MSVKQKTWIARHIDDVEPVPCPCGSSWRIITRDDTEVSNIHVTHIMDSQKHYHERCSEYYYILEGEGKLELDGEVVELRPGLAVFIPEGIAHRGWGDFRAVIVGIPAWDPQDEVIVE